MLSESHVPHSSSTLLPLGTPAQSAHEELSPAHIPHSSVSFVAQSGSASSPFETHPEGAYTSQKSVLSPYPRPSPSLSL